MTTISHFLEADLAVIPDVDGIAARTVVALPPSDVDPVWDEMRVVINGAVIYRAFDPGEAIVTGAPLTFLTEGGDDLLTEAGDNIVTEVVS